MKKNLWLIGGVVIFFITLSIDLYTDLKIGDEVNHQRGLALRLIGLVPCAFCLIAYCKHRDLITGIIVISMIGFNYWNLFDGLYNIFRGYGWFFTGSEDGAGDASTDNILQSIPLWAGALIKILGSLVTIYLYYKNKVK